MIIEEFDRRPQIEEVALKTDPFYVWLDTRTRMTIQKGDKSREIGEALSDHWGLKPVVARRMARYYMGLRRYLRTGDLNHLQAPIRSRDG